MTNHAFNSLKIVLLSWLLLCPHMTSDAQELK
jgi:hypothetical protein